MRVTKKVKKGAGPIELMIVQRENHLVSDMLATRAKIRILNDPKFQECCRKLQALPAWNEEVEDLNLFLTSDTAELEISLKKGLTQPKLVRQVVLAGYAHKLRKSPRYDNTSLMVTGQLFPEVDFEWGRMRIEVTDYLPQTCTVEYEEVEVPARMERRAKITCIPTGEAEPRVVGFQEPLTDDELNTV